MNRRHFLAGLGALAAGMALDPERALWVPGRRTFFDVGAARRQEDFIDGILRRGTATFRLDFGDGGVWEFGGVPPKAGPENISIQPVTPIRQVRPAAAAQAEPVTAPFASLEREGSDGFTHLAHVQEIDMPKVTRDPDAGLRRVSDISFNVVWTPLT